MKTKLIILGSGNSFGVPWIDSSWGKCNKKNKKNIRSRCSAIIIKGNNSILIDTSPDIKKQFIDNKIKNLSSVLYTHEHSDQTNGIFELRPFFFKNKNKINVYGNLRTIQLLRKRFDFCFKSNYIYPAILKSNIIKKNFCLGLNNEKVNFNTFQLKHGNIKTTAYLFEKTLYISDCNDFSIIKEKKFKNLNHLIIDCLRIERNVAHFNLENCLFIQKQLKPKKTFLTNLSNHLDYDSLLKNLPKNTFPAYDGLKLNL